MERKRTWSKRIGAMLLVCIMVMLMSLTVFAAPSIGEGAPTEGTITVTKEGSGFTAYSVLDAKQSGDAYVYTASAEFADFFGQEVYGSYKVEDIPKLGSAQEIKTFAAQLHKFVTDRQISGIQLESGVKKEVSLGYYLILETASKSQGAVVASTAMLASVPQEKDGVWNYEVLLLPKDSEADLDKSIVVYDGKSGTKKVNTSTAAIGEKIQYEVTAGIPVYEENAVNIKYQITDTLSKGLTFDTEQMLFVTAGQYNLEQDKDYIFQMKKESDGTTKLIFDFKYDKIKGYIDEGIKLSYAAKLNENAIVHTSEGEGNPNTVVLEYTNNPDIQDSFKTLNDKVTTYTWGFGVHKVDSENIMNDLAGAVFQLKDEVEQEVGKYTYDADGKVIVLKGNAVTTENGMVYFTGLKEGTYKIYEVQAPKGYSLLGEPVEVTITPVKQDGAEYTGAAEIEITNGNSAATKETDVTMKDGNVLFQVKIKNHKGISLPGAGGTGAKGIISIGIVLVGIAVVLLAGYGWKNHRKLKRGM